MSNNYKLLPSNYCRCGKVRLFSIFVSASLRVLVDITPSDGRFVASSSTLMDTVCFRLQLYHNAHDDRNDYYEDAYLSCPLQPFAQWLTAGRDSIVLDVNTYQGQHTAVFPF